MADSDDFLNCTVCSQLYESPKILPGCGHFFCLRCIQKFLDERTKIVTCPNCTLPSRLGASGLEGLVTCVGVAEIVLKSKKSKGPSPVPEPFPPVSNPVPELPADVICSHADSVETPTLCPHCSASFCKPCLASHMKRLKAEIISLRTDRAQKVESKAKELKKVLADSNATFQKAVNASKVEIKKGLGDIFDEISSIIEDKRAELVRAVNTSGGEKMRIANAVLEKAKANLAVATQVLHILLAKSARLYTPETLTEINSNLHKLGEAFEEMEKLTKSDFVGHLAFDATSSEEEYVLYALNESLKASLRPDLAFEEKANVASKLHTAARQGEVDYVKFILDGLDVPASMIEHSDESDYSRTLLHQASENGSLELVRYLVLGEKAKLDALDAGHALPVHVAAANGRSEVVEFLLSEMERQFPDKKQVFELESLRVAVASNRVNVVELLISRNAELLNTRSEGGQSLLHSASQFGHAEIVRFLIEKGLDKSALDGSGKTALDLVTEGNPTEVVDILN